MLKVEKLFKHSLQILCTNIRNAKCLQIFPLLISFEKLIIFKCWKRVIYVTGNLIMFETELVASSSLGICRIHIKCSQSLTITRVFSEFSGHILLLDTHFVLNIWMNRMYSNTGTDNVHYFSKCKFMEMNIIEYSPRGRMMTSKNSTSSDAEMATSKNFTAGGYGHELVLFGTIVKFNILTLTRSFVSLGFERKSKSNFGK